VVAIITARGGSRGIPYKNVADLGGRPLVVWSIEAARRSKCVTRLVVSTDDKAIADAARQHGAEVPFLRPAELGWDSSSHVEAVVHALEWMRENEQRTYEYVLVLQPTSPFRSAEDIDHACAIVARQPARAVVGVSAAANHPYLTKKIRDDGSLEDFMPIPEGYLARQSLPEAYAVNGAIYVVRTDVLLDERTFFPEPTFAYAMPPERSLDIDTEWDLHLARLIAGAADHAPLH